MSTHSAVAEEPWLVIAEAPAAVPITAEQGVLFDPGAMPAIALYRPLAPWLLLGLRVRGGALGDGAAPEPGHRDPDLGGLGSLTLGMRLRPPTPRVRRGDGLWFELATGGAVTGMDFRPTFEVGLGWGFQLGAINVGPSLRYVHVRNPDRAVPGSSAGIALVGVEISLFDASPAPAAWTPRHPLAAITARGEDSCADPDGCSRVDADRDRVSDDPGGCPTATELVDGTWDRTGCPDLELFVLDQERIVLEEEVLFDYRRARVKRRAMPVLQAIVAKWREHPEWDRLVIVGHADLRGPKDYNQRLSEIRAKRVRDALVELGLPPHQVETRGHGERRPQDLDSHSQRRNRRVEFVIVKSNGREVSPR